MGFILGSPILGNYHLIIKGLQLPQPPKLGFDYSRMIVIGSLL